MEIWELRGRLATSRPRPGATTACIKRLRALSRDQPVTSTTWSRMRPLSFLPALRYLPAYLLVISAGPRCTALAVRHRQSELAAERLQLLVTFGCGFGVSHLEAAEGVEHDLGDDESGVVFVVGSLPSTDWIWLLFFMVVPLL